MAVPPDMLVLHHAGGSAVPYRGLVKSLGSRFRTRVVELPGRGATMGAKPCWSAREAVAFCLDVIGSEGMEPAGVFGHSMGAVIAFELAAELERRGTPAEWLGLSASRPPGRPHPSRVRRDLWDDARLVAFLRELGGTPTELLEDPGTVAYMLGVLRPDLAIVDTYTPSVDAPLGTYTEVFHGADDPVLEGVEDHHWQACFRNEVRRHTWPDGHFYLFGREDELAAAICASFDRAVEWNIRERGRQDVS
ncbi:thioesterase II family protein [Streptomyces sp. NPDC048751]|uniref:thioesterase II family protein n=1 Tax=Streptomyces sp. NPDC048751 TaxID=3365591 RepID=UPI003723A2D6